jgi:hypothetical protein
MARFPREELEEMVRRFTAANDEAGRTHAWGKLADFYSEDAVYSWNVGPRHEFVARGREEIRETVFGTEMAGLEKWTYPYVKVLIDDAKGEVIGIWRQIAPAPGPDGKPMEIAGTGGSWFKYAGSYQWRWQRDFFDFANATAAFVAMAKAGRLSEAMQERLATSGLPRGWVRREAFDWYASIPADED